MFTTCIAASTFILLMQSIQAVCNAPRSSFVSVVRKPEKKYIDMHYVKRKQIKKCSSTFIKLLL